MIDDPNTNDNRRYVYTECEQYRDEYPIIESMISMNARVIDLGCGNGSLLKLLKDKKNINGCGIEISQSGVDICLEKKLDVWKTPIDELLIECDNKKFDYAICNVTIQMVMYPEILLSEMKRIAKYQIVSFPNFGHLANRLDMLIHGRMPRPFLFGYQWYNTGHIHQLSVNDFKELIEKNNMEIIKQVHFGWGITKLFRNQFPNLFATESIYMLRG